MGCIPKKLMHQAGILGESFSDAKEFGWNVKSEGHDWNKMVTAIQVRDGGGALGCKLEGLRCHTTLCAPSVGHDEVTVPRAADMQRSRRVIGRVHHQIELCAFAAQRNTPPPIVEHHANPRSLTPSNTWKYFHP